jgi:hypothetical protein
MYDIEITYKTGNSFGSHTEVDLLHIPVSSIETAKINLARIKEHYKIYDKKHNSYRSPSEQLQIKLPDFYISEYYETNSKTNKKYKCECDGIKFLTDSTEHEVIGPFWIGYFERLLSARVVVVGDELEFSM